MNMDKAVFGYSDFTITDDSLFNSRPKAGAGTI